MLNRFICIVLCILFFNVARAADTWSLSKIVQQATEQSFALKAGEQDVNRAVGLAHQAGRWDNPAVSLSAGPYKDNGVEGDSSSVTVTQSVPLFGQKRIAGQVAEQEKLVAESERDKGRLLFQHEVVRLTYQLAAITEQEKHISHRRERLGLIARYLKSRPFASPAQAVEKNLIENRLREIEERFVQITLEKERAWQNLNVYLGLESAIAPDVKWYDQPLIPSQEELNTLAMQANPELIRQSRSVVSAQLQVDQAGKQAYPDLRLGASSYNQKVGGSTEKSFAGIVEVSVPIWNRGGGASEAARAQLASEKFKLEHQKRELISELKKEWAHLNESKRRIELYPRSLVDILEKQMRVAEQNWRRGLVTAPAFLELESQVHEQAAKVYDAQTDYVQALSQLQLIVGRFYDVGGN